MTDRLINLFKSQAAGLDHSLGQLRCGIVTSVDSLSATVRVMIQPEGVLSGWLPVLSIWTGNGWGIAAPLTPGDQVVILPQEGDAEQGIVIGGIFSMRSRPPPVPVGELWIVHQTGTALKMCNDGSVRINGNLYVSGDIYDSHGALSVLRTHYDEHTHMIPLGGKTSLPDPVD